MTPDLARIGCASIPADALAALADLRREPGISVVLVGDRAWVGWDAGSEVVLHRVLPIPGAELFEQREGHWYRLGHRLPTFRIPVVAGAGGSVGLPLHRVIFPAPVRPEPPGNPTVSPLPLALVVNDRARPSSALCCRLEALAAWVESAPSARIAALRGAMDGERVLVIGRPLPTVMDPCTRRYWGERVLVPIGFQPEPDLPEPALRRALNAAEGNVLILGHDGVETVPERAFNPLTRAGVRLAWRSVRHDG